MERIIDRVFWRFAIAAAAVFLVVMLVRSCSQSHTPTAATRSTNATTAVLPNVKPPHMRTAPRVRAQSAPAVVTAAGVTTQMPTATAGAATTGTLAPTLTPPSGLAAGLALVTKLGKDQFGEWLSTGTPQVVKEAELKLTVPAPPVGAVGARRTVFTAWITVKQPVQTVTLRVAGGAAHAAVSIDKHWSLAVTHSNLFSAAPDSTQAVVALSAGWHLATITVDRTPSTLDTAPTGVELQLGTGDVDPIVPTPYAAPPTQNTKPASAASTSAPHAGPRVIPTRQEPAGSMNQDTSA